MARTDTLANYLIDIADAIREKTGSSDLIQASSFDTAIEGIPSGGGNTEYTGHVDTQGLLSIGWTQDDIDDFQEHGVFWNEEDDNIYKLTADDLAGELGNKCRYYHGDAINNFAGYYRVLAIPKSKLSTYYGSGVPFNNCCSLKYISEFTWNTSTIGTNVFSSCLSLMRIKKLQLPVASTCGNMFQNCYNLRRIDYLSIKDGASISNMFKNCYSLEYVGGTTIKPYGWATSMFENCYNLIKPPAMDTSEVTSIDKMFNNCYSLSYLPELDFGAVTTSSIYSFLCCYSLVHVGGFKDYGKAFSTSQSENYSSYTLTLTSCSNLTHDSLMNIINDLYDIATKGCNPQKISLGDINLAKLTAEEIAIATNKGWNVV